MLVVQVNNCRQIINMLVLVLFVHLNISYCRLKTKFSLHEQHLLIKKYLDIRLVLITLLSKTLSVINKIN